jgi:uncharacterized membrane protein
MIKPVSRFVTVMLPFRLAPSSVVPVGLLAGAWAIVLFGCGVLRHWMFKSGVWDLGFFDQALYLISQGLPTQSSFIGYRAIGDHAAVLLYPLALLYRIVPSVYWLFGVQALALAGAGLGAWAVARQAKLSDRGALILGAVYWLYPLVFNVNLFDFHVEVLAVPALFGAIWAVRANRMGGFIGCLLVALGSKDTVSVAVVGLGLSLWIEGRRRAAALAIGLGLGWFALATQWIIPVLGGASVDRYAGRYGALGNSVGAIIVTLLTRPLIVLQTLLTVQNFEYLLLLLLPLVWVLIWGRPRIPTLWVAAVPIVGLNLLASYGAHKDLVHQYSLPILPFLIVGAIDTVAQMESQMELNRADRSIPRSPRIHSRWILLWAVVWFAAAAKFGWFWTKYNQHPENRVAMAEAIATIPAHEGRILATSGLAAHLSQRAAIYFIEPPTLPDPNAYDYVVINFGSRELKEETQYNQALLQSLQTSPVMALSYRRGPVYRFDRQ